MKNNILTIIILQALLLTGLVSCAPEERKERADAVLSIIPQPNKITVYEGVFRLSASTQLVFNSEEQHKIADYFARELQKKYGISLQTGGVEVAENKIVLEHSDVLASEAYELKVNSEEISISASSEAGYFYAFQTLLQMAPVLTKESAVLEIDQVSIIDQPRFPWRGAMLDISRHYFGPDVIKQLIDQMAAKKMNRLHLHLTDDTGWRIEIKEYPKLHEIGSRGDRTNPDGPQMYLTEEDARGITAYANERQIIIVPEVDVPGHSGAIEKAYPAFSGGNNTLNIANEDAVKMIQTVMLRVASLFNTNYVHFGSDEVRHHNWEARPDMLAKMKELGLKNQREFEGWFDRNMADYLLESELKPIAWDEASGFGVNKNAILQWWRGEYPDILFNAAKDGYNVILSPVDYLYLDYTSDLEEAGAIWEGLHNGANSMEAIYHWSPIPESFTDDMVAKVLGLEAGIWTEFISDKTRLEYMTYPRLDAVAEKAWSFEENLDWELFQERLIKQYKRYENDGVNYRIPNLSVEERKVRQPEAFNGPILD
ncbi:beta-N-acetylhexosaminidase [Arenibacter latericius]|uniref:beta-N-acetylhexosaminidase n=1 Tax=Arenibacter latericius TaxID=86104 RepID=UPI0003F67C19|nr:beta-N-acetylhexosaminidase [Arenibacter latericius]